MPIVPEVVVKRKVHHAKKEKCDNGNYPSNNVYGDIKSSCFSKPWCHKYKF